MRVCGKFGGLSGDQFYFKPGLLGVFSTQEALTTLRLERTMAKPILDTARLHELLHYDPLTGEFRWLVNRHPNKTKGALAGSPDEEGYIRIGIDKRRYRAHRLAWFYMHGVWPDDEVDHRNGVRTDNSLLNLRVVTRSVNMQNMRKSPAKASTLPMGVNRGPQGLYAQIFANGRKINLGKFETPEAAHDAYIAAKRQLHAGCTL
jgi:hypothetical protein